MTGPIGFAGTLGFAVVASLALVVAQLVAAPWLGRTTVLALFLVCAAAGYAALLPAQLRHRALAAGAALGAGALALVLAPGIAELAVGLAVVVALVRAFAQTRSTPLRTLAVELVLGVGGLALALLLASPGLLGAAAGFWGYALVQSFGGLVPGEQAPWQRSCEGDPFERACARLDELLEKG